MYNLIKKIKEVNAMLKHNKMLIISAQEYKNDIICKPENFATIEEIEQYSYGRAFKILAKSKRIGKIVLLIKFSDEEFYIKDIETDELYMSASNELEENTKKVTVLKCLNNFSEFYSYLSRNGENELIRAAIKDNENNKKLLITNTEIDSLTDMELAEYATEIQLGGMIDNMFVQNMNVIKSRPIDLKDNEEEIRKDINDSYEEYRHEDNELYSEIQEDEDVLADVQEYLKKYKVTLNTQEIDKEKATVEIGNAMNAIDEEEVQILYMYNYCLQLYSLLKLQIARTQETKISENRLSDKEY